MFPSAQKDDLQIDMPLKPGLSTEFHSSECELASTGTIYSTILCTPHDFMVFEGSIKTMFSIS